MRQAVTFRSELRRGFNRYNLSVGLAASLGVAVVVFALSSSDILPLLASSAGAQALYGGLIAFTVITGLHVSMHGYFGWRFENGLRAHAAGNHTLAIRLLSPVEKGGLAHYDEGGFARAALEESRRSAL